mgnify:CR=1 FL=1
MVESISYYYQKYGHAELAQARDNVDKARMYMDNSVLVIGVLSGYQKKREVVLSSTPLGAYIKIGRVWIKSSIFIL